MKASSQGEGIYLSLNIQIGRPAILLRVLIERPSPGRLRRDRNFPSFHPSIERFGKIMYQVAGGKLCSDRPVL